MEDTTRASAPAHLWIVGILGTLWNCLRVLDFVMTETANKDHLARYGADATTYYMSVPEWFVAFWALGVWGGLAGCMPVIIGWSAVTGTIGWPAWVFFGVIFFWTPPHTWALAMRYREDYKAAGVPMLPVVATEREVVRQIVLYSWAMVVCSLLLVPASSWIYAAVAVPIGLWFLAMAHLLHTRVLRGAAAKPMTLFHLSNLYLTGISVAWAVDSVVGLHVLGWPW